VLCLLTRVPGADAARCENRGHDGLPSRTHRGARLSFHAFSLRRVPQPLPARRGLQLLRRPPRVHPKDLKAADRQEAIALITIRGVVQSIFGYPNEEAFWKDPRGDLGHGFFEVADSPWTDEINDYNVATFGTEYMSGSAARHFFIGSKDASAQFLARDLAVEVFTGQPSDWVHGEALRRLSQ
jgi:hypothetical protein